MFIIDTLVAFTKLVTMLVIINVTVQALCSILIIFTCPGYWKSQGISCGLESGHPVMTVLLMMMKLCNVSLQYLYDRVTVISAFLCFCWPLPAGGISCLACLCGVRACVSVY